MSSSQPPNQNPPSVMPLPEGVGPKNFPSLTDADVHLGNTTEFFNSFDNAFVNGPVSNLYNFFIKEKRQYVDDAPPATDDQISAFKEEAPGVNIPKGTKLNVAQFLTEDQKQQNTRDAVSSLAEPGITGTLSKVTGSLLGTVAAPGNAITATVAPELVGVKSVAFDAAFGEEGQAAVDASPVLKNAIEGIAVGAGISAPAQVIQQFKNSAFNQNWSTWNALKNIGASMAVGGTIGAAFGSLLHFLPEDAATTREASPLQDAKPGSVGDKINKFAPFGDEASQQAAQTAIVQNFEGRDVNVDLILKNALKENYNTFLNTMQDGQIPEALDLLKQSRDVIQRNIDKNRQEVDSPQTQEKIINLNGEHTALQQQLDTHDAFTKMLMEGVPPIQESDVKEYIDGNDPVKGAFQNSGVIEPEPDLGEPIQNEQNLLGDIFPKDYQKQLEENQGLTPEEKGVKSEITDRKTNEKTFNRMLAAAKNCLLGL